MEGYRELGVWFGWTGINTDFIPEKLPPEEKSVYLTGGNNILVKNGLIQKLKGTDYLEDVSTQLGTASYRNVLGLETYRQYDGDRFLVAALPRKIYYLTGTPSWDDITGTATIVGENDSIFSHANSDNKFFFVISDDGVIYEWNGSGNISASSLTAEGVTTLKSRFLLEFKTFLILLRTIEDATEYHQRFWASNAGVVTTFSSSDKLDLEEEGVILGGKVLEDSIIVYFSKNIYRVYWNYKMGWLHHFLAKGGLIAPKTLCGNENVHFFLSEEGLMRLLYGDIPRSVSDQKFNKLVLDKLDPVYYERAAAKFYKHSNLLFLSYPVSGSNYNNRQLIYDNKTGELVSIKDLGSENYAIYGEHKKDLSGLTPTQRQDYGLSFIPIIGNKDGYIKEQKMNAYQDGVANYESSVVFPPSFLRSKSRNKRVLQVDLLVEKFTDEDISFTIELANEMNENFLYSYTITGNGNAGIRRYELKTDNSGNRTFGTALDANSGSSTSEYAWRNLVPAASFSIDSGEVRVKLEAASDLDTYIAGCYIGEKAASGDAFDMQPGTISQFLFSASGTILIPAGTTATSDWLTYSFDKTKDYFISIGTGDGSNGKTRVQTSSQTYYKKSGAQAEAGVADVTGYDTDTGSVTFRELEVSSNSVDIFGKEIRGKIKDVSNQYGFHVHGIIYLGYYSTRK